MKRPDVCIAGAGVIGLTLALALERRGLSVLVLTAGEALAEASTAAAGMLAVDDPDNPAELLALARFSRSLYPALLASLDLTASHTIRFQTHRTLQAVSPSARPAARLSNFLPHAAIENIGFIDLQEESLDPRELAPALLSAVHASRVELKIETPVLSVEETAHSVQVRATHGEIDAGCFVDCTGAWSLSTARVPTLRVTPRKGQMLTVPTPPSLAEGIVLRTPEIYLVPRTHGPSAGETLVGATVEDVGFDRSLNPHQLAHLLDRAAALLPELRSARMFRRWSGLRPATEDHLPILGRLPGSDRLFIASGHYRNGILLAPGTAQVIAQRIAGETPSVSLDAFSPARFDTAAQQHHPA